MTSKSAKTGKSAATKRSAISDEQLEGVVGGSGRHHAPKKTAHRSKHLSAKSKKRH